MTSDKLAFVSFETESKGFKAFLSIEGLVYSKQDPEVASSRASELYEESIKKMRIMLSEIENFRSNRKNIPARKIWQLGNSVFKLKENLEKLSLQIDDLYFHLVRDIGVKRKWLEKVIVLRRYLPKQSLIPKSLNWGRCEKGTRRIAEKLRNGSLVK